MSQIATVELPPAPDTTDNAEIVRHWHGIVSRSGEGILEAARKAGEALLVQRDLCGTTRGGSTFSRWCDERLAFSYRTARDYMRIAENWDLLRGAPRSSGEPLSIREATKIVTESKREEKEAERIAAYEDYVPPEGSKVISDLSEIGPDEKYACVYADPPWQYGNQGTRAATDNHYPTMPLADIIGLPIKDIVADKAVLFLWTTNGFLFESKDLIDAWGFTFKSSMVWVKPQMGIGNYVRNSHELLLICTRGGMRTNGTSQRSWEECLEDEGTCIESPRGRHSAKPSAFRDIIERISVGPRIELFGRQEQPGWTIWGNQVERNLFCGGKE